MSTILRFRVNGTEYTEYIDPFESVLHVLRNKLGLVGTKMGCGQGVCGACTVMIDRQLATGCLTLAASVDGKEVTTIEGLSQEALTIQLQESFIEYGAVQCGMCTPGQIVAATALLTENPNPTLDEVRLWMTGNICRCTGYSPIVDAILGCIRSADESR